MDDLELELKEGFLEEASDLILKAESAFLSLENHSQDQGLLDQIFRLAHNLKGTSRAVGFGEMAELTHQAENLILCLKEQKFPVDDEIVTVLLEFNDFISGMVATLKMDMSVKVDKNEIEQKIANIISSKSNKDKNIPKIYATNETTVENDENISPKESLRGSNFVTEEVECKAIQNKEENVVNKIINVQQKSEKIKEDETIRVSTERLQKLNDAVGEMVILQAQIESALIGNSDYKISRSLAKISREIQHLSISLRMVPISPTFQKLARIVRDVSKLLNKKSIYSYWVKKLKLIKSLLKISEIL